MNIDFEFFFVEIKINILLILKRLGKNCSLYWYYKIFYLVKLGVICFILIIGKLIFIDKFFIFKND